MDKYTDLLLIQKKLTFLTNWLHMSESANYKMGEHVEFINIIKVIANIERSVSYLDLCLDIDNERQ